MDDEAESLIDSEGPSSSRRSSLRRVARPTVTVAATCDDADEPAKPEDEQDKQRKRQERQRALLERSRAARSQARTSSGAELAVPGGPGVQPLPSRAGSPRAPGGSPRSASGRTSPSPPMPASPKCPPGASPRTSSATRPGGQFGDEACVAYEVVFVTGTKYFAGTSAKVHVALHGVDGTIAKRELVNWEKTGLSRGQAVGFPLKGTDIGDIWMIELWKSDSVLSNRWHLESALVYRRDTHETWTFPAFRWMGPHEHLRSGVAYLPQNELCDAARTQREEELEEKRREYKVHKSELGIPCFAGGSSDLPEEQRYDTERQLSDFNQKSKATALVTWEYMVSEFKFRPTFDSYMTSAGHEFAKQLPPTALMTSWQDDVTFGLQLLQGAGLQQLYRIDDIPAGFPVDAARLEPLIGMPLDRALRRERIFLTDATFLSGLRMKAGRYTAAPLCLYALNNDDNLVPVAIQLFPKPSPQSNPIFYANDPHPDWLLAKICVANGIYIKHQLGDLLIGTHFATEGFILATHRELARAHPIYKLLAPHFKWQLPVNMHMRKELLQRDSMLDRLLPLQYEDILIVLGEFWDDWNFESPVATLKNRQIPTDQRDVPHYHLISDAARLFSAISEFVHTVLSRHYRRPEDLRADTELQSWISELTTTFGYDKKGVPTSIPDLDALVELVASLIWTASAEHAMINFSQYESFGFVPAAPASLYRAPPGFYARLTSSREAISKGHTTIAQVTEFLPPLGLAAAQAAFARLFSTFSADDYFLGQYPENLFNGDHFKRALETFRSRLRGIAEEIDFRGEWDFLHPKNIPASTSI
eukprot:TRINITY_DN6928_c0_g1_i2.p1 TRINITY_DN6928_c0_g1~~TRINITY_DN6928_c0_g1_i2.p1  ORF type:complete len:817 (+),score=278.22 TRINITY_DN6928_c0_g1_i2:137-2587(+)